MSEAAGRSLSCWALKVIARWRQQKRSQCRCLKICVDVSVLERAFCSVVVYWMGWRKVKGGGLVCSGGLVVLARYSFRVALAFWCTFDATLLTVLC